jgi:hypothetical protein
MADDPPSVVAGPETVVWAPASVDLEAEGMDAVSGTPEERAS